MWGTGRRARLNPQKLGRFTELEKRGEINFKGKTMEDEKYLVH